MEHMKGKHKHHQKIHLLQRSVLPCWPFGSTQPGNCKVKTIISRHKITQDNLGKILNTVSYILGGRGWRRGILIENIIKMKGKELVIKVQK